MTQTNSKKTIFDVAVSVADEYDTQTGEYKDVHVEELRAILKDKPDLLKSLNDIITTAETREQLFKMIHGLNDKWGTNEKRHGDYFVVHFVLPSGEGFKIKVFKGMGNALSFSND